MLKQLPYLLLKNDEAIYPGDTMEDLGSNLSDATLHGVKQYSSHPNDQYLRVVLAQWKHNIGEWVTWVANTNHPSVFSGNYFETHKEALADYHNRGRLHKE
jgi:hypothetical protein